MNALQVAVLCDFAEENWPSMDISATMLLDQLNACGPEQVRATRIQPRMKRFFQSAPGHKLASAGFNADRLLNRFLFYPHAAASLPPFDLFHVIDHSYAQLVHRLAPARTVVTCHDVDTFDCLLGSRDGQRQLKRPYWFRKMVLHTLRGLCKAAAIVCVSEATRAALYELEAVAPERIHVVPNGIHRHYRAEPDAYWDAAAGRLLGPADATLDLLHVGSSVPRKRIDVLLQVFAACTRRRRGLRLIRVGSPLTAGQRDLAHRLGLEKLLVCLPFVKEEMLAALYRRAAVVLVTSEAEGFGLPLAEAMACGTPVVASEIPALREVAGGCATHCAVGAVEEWTEAVLALLEQKELSIIEGPGGAWRRIVAAGRARARSFTWESNAAAMVEIYKSTLLRIGRA